MLYKLKGNLGGIGEASVRAIENILTRRDFRAGKGACQSEARNFVPSASIATKLGP